MGSRRARRRRSTRPRSFERDEGRTDRLLYTVTGSSPSPATAHSLPSRMQSSDIQHPLFRPSSSSSSSTTSAGKKRQPAWLARSPHWSACYYIRSHPERPNSLPGSAATFPPSRDFSPLSPPVRTRRFQLTPSLTCALSSCSHGCAGSVRLCRAAGRGRAGEEGRSRGERAMGRWVSATTARGRSRLGFRGSERAQGTFWIWLLDWRARGRAGHRTLLASVARADPHPFARLCCVQKQQWSRPTS